MITLIFNFIIIPGFLFTSLVGLLASWIDRKVTARIQWRVGPPLLQPVYDIIKLLGKEVIVPRGSGKITFLLAPVFGLAAVILVATLLGVTIFSPQKGFIGDIIVVIYLLTIPSIAIIIGGAASGNPLASLGASREMKLILAYELPFILAIAVVIIKGGSIRIGELINFQLNNGIFIKHPSGVLAFIVAIMCMQAKLALVPFDMPEAETEIMGGALIEYSGAPLAVFKLTKSMLLYVLPLFLIAIFWGGVDFSGGTNLEVFLSILKGIGKYVILLVIIILIKNTNPRLRIDQALKFFWGPMTILAIIGVVLAMLGR